MVVVVEEWEGEWGDAAERGEPINIMKTNVQASSDLRVVGSNSRSYSASRGNVVPCRCTRN